MVFCVVFFVMLALFAWGLRTVHKKLRANGFSWPWLSGFLLYLLAGGAVLLMFLTAALSELGDELAMLRWFLQRLRAG
jgi:hypothetical protein